METRQKIEETRLALGANLAEAREANRKIGRALAAQQRAALASIDKSRKMIDDSLRLLREVTRQGF